MEHGSSDMTPHLIYEYEKEPVTFPSKALEQLRLAWSQQSTVFRR